MTARASQQSHILPGTFVHASGMHTALISHHIGRLLYDKFAGSPGEQIAIFGVKDLVLPDTRDAATRCAPRDAGQLSFTTLRRLRVKLCFQERYRVTGLVLLCNILQSRHMLLLTITYNGMMQSTAHPSAIAT